MGGPFSAQAADLHSLWCFHLRKQQFYSLGKLGFTDAAPCGSIVVGASFHLRSSVTTSYGF